eukprot:SM000190S04839  [mRNA]  locus=s190:42605:45561:+ [translate_table: standard]
MDRGARIYVAGHRGLVGAAIARRLQANGHTDIVTRTHKGAAAATAATSVVAAARPSPLVAASGNGVLDLTRQADVERFFEEQRPVYVILAAAKVGGIHANSTYPADFIAVNLQIQLNRLAKFAMLAAGAGAAIGLLTHVTLLRAQTNVIDAAYRSGVKKLLFLGSSCIYPKFAPQPIPEDSLLSGPLEPTNEWYAVAKIAGIKMCQAYRLQYGFDAVSGMPTNLYGPHDNFHPENSHVLPALVRRFHEAKKAGAKEVVCWGTGSPLREFLHVDDLADACIYIMEHYSDIGHLNVGSGKEVTIKELAELVKEVVGFQGELVWDPTKPDGTPRKLMDSSKLAALGWEAKVALRDGLTETYKWYTENYDDLKDCYAMAGSSSNCYNSSVPVARLRTRSKYDGGENVST